MTGRGDIIVGAWRYQVIGVYTPVTGFFTRPGKGGGTIRAK